MTGKRCERGMSPMKIGTLSSELLGSEMRMSSTERIRAIEKVIRVHNPDILLAAGFSVQADDDLVVLGDCLSDLAWDGLLFAEVMHHDGSPSRSLAISSVVHELSAHCLFAWTASEGWRKLGRQYFTTSEEANTHKDTLIAAFADALPNREVSFRGKRVGALICGEINALQGRNEVSSLTPEIGGWLRGLDIVVNPTHDRMGNGGTLKAKRISLSRPELGRTKVYVSSSNWNSRKDQGGRMVSQSRNAETLHTVYVNGEAEKMIAHPDPDFEYREVTV